MSIDYKKLEANLATAALDAFDKFVAEEISPKAGTDAQKMVSDLRTALAASTTAERIMLAMPLIEDIVALYGDLPQTPAAPPALIQPGN